MISEAFVVCENYRPPAGYIPQIFDPIVKDIEVIQQETTSEVNRRLIPFIVCGDLRAHDSDMSYPLQVR